MFIDGVQLHVLVVSNLVDNMFFLNSFPMIVAQITIFSDQTSHDAGEIVHPRLAVSSGYLVVLSFRVSAALTVCLQISPFRVGPDIGAPKNFIFADPLLYHTLILPGVLCCHYRELGHFCDIGLCELTEQFETTFVQTLFC